MNEAINGGKPEYHQSHIMHYFECARAMKLSMIHDIELNRAMRMGLMLEFKIFGMNPRAKKEFKSPEIYEKYIGKGLGAVGYETVIRVANTMRPIFLDGDSFVKLRAEFKDYDSEGESDFVGNIQYADQEGNESIINCLADCKFTGDITNWALKKSTEDYFQAAYYVWLFYEMTDIIKPFIYVVGDGKSDPTIIGQYKINFEKMDFKYVESIVRKIHGDIVKPAWPSFNRCVKGKYNSRCDFVEKCDEGRMFLSGTKEIDFAELVRMEL